MLKEHGWFPNIIEGESKVVIQMEIKLQNGSQTLKVARSWHLQARVEALQESLQDGMATNFTHIHTKGNKVADLLAN